VSVVTWSSSSQECWAHNTCTNQRKRRKRTGGKKEEREEKEEKEETEEKEEKEQPGYYEGMM